MTSNLYLPALPLTLFKCHTKHQGWTPSPAGRGGSPPRPAKMIKTAGKLRGKIKARFSNLSDRGNHWWYNITKVNNAQFSPSIGYSRDTILYIIYNPIRRAILVDYRWNKVKCVNLFALFFANRASNFVLQNMSTYEIPIHVPRIILGAVGCWLVYTDQHF